MKTYRMKGLLTAGMAVVLATGAFAAGDMKAAMEHIRSNQQQVNQDLIKVNRQQQRVKTAGQACRIEKTAAAHKEYKDAKADLREYKAQLKKDNKDLIAAHREHIKIHEDEAKAERKALQTAQFKLDRDKAMRSEATLSDADKLMAARENFRSHLNNLERARLERDKDNWVVNHEYYDMGAKSNLQLTINSTTNSNNTAQK